MRKDDDMTAPPATGPRPREAAVRHPARHLPATLSWPAALLRGPVDLLDFLLPLWVGLQWGLSPTAIGALVAVEAAASLLGRPVAGWWVDRSSARPVVAVGAALYAASFAGYAVAGAPAMLFGAAVVGGIGGALSWVGLRALTGDGTGDLGGAFSELVAAEATGTWVAFVAGLTLLPQLDYRGVFVGCAVACAAAGAIALFHPRPPRGDAAHLPSSSSGSGYAAISRRARLMLVVVALTAAAEAGVGLLMLLHLQRGFGLDVGAVAAAFLPGFVVYSLAPPYLNRLVGRVGRSVVLVGSLCCSAAFAVGLAVAPNPWVIAALWVLAALALAGAVPIGQSVTAEVSQGALGRGMALYESATLVGVLVGGAAAGALYDSSGGWWTACVAATVVLAVAAALAPRALRAAAAATPPRPVHDGRSGAGGTRATASEGVGPEVPRPAAADEGRVDVPRDTGGRGSAHDTGLPDTAHDTGRPGATHDTGRTGAAHDTVADRSGGAVERVGVDPPRDDGDPPGPVVERAPVSGTRPARRRFDLSNWVFHLGVWLLAQIGLALAGWSWVVEAVVGGPHPSDWWWNDSGHWLLNVGRIWTFVLVLDTAYSLGRWGWQRARERRGTVR